MARRQGSNCRFAPLPFNPIPIYLNLLGYLTEKLHHTSGTLSFHYLLNFGHFHLDVTLAIGSLIDFAVVIFHKNNLSVHNFPEELRL